MKKLSYLLSLLLVMTLAVFTSCKDDGVVDTTPTPLEEATEMVSGTWTVTSVTRPEVTGNVIEGETVTLTFTEAGGYTAVNADVMPGDNPSFPAGANWAFGSTTAPFNRIVIKPSNVEFNFSSLTASAMTFTYTTRDTKSPDADVLITVSATKAAQ